MSAAVARLGRARADRITAQLAGAADLMLDLVVQAYLAEVWTEYGLESWAAYVTAKVPALRVIGKGLPLEERREACADLRGRGLSVRGLGEVLGLAPNTVRAALADTDQPAQVISLDGSRRSSAGSRTPARRRTGPPVTDRLVALLAGAGPDGLTVREVCQRARMSRESVSPALFRLSAAGRVLYVRPARRGQFGRYVVRLEP